MANLQFRSFIWPHNPSTFVINYENRVIKHEFPDIDGAETEELGMSPRTFSGSGAFYGEDAYSNFLILDAYSVNNSVGTLVHPKYGKFTVRLVSITSKEESVPNYVEYDFQFVEHKELTVVVKKTPTPKPGDGSSGVTHKYPGVLKRGSRGSNVKLVQGVVGTTKDGIFGPKTEAAVKAYQKKHKLTVDGIVGPKTWEMMFRKTEDDKDDRTKRYYVVKSGDTLGKISKKYYNTTTKWKKIADANKSLIKNPNSIKVGWKLNIPY